MNDLFFLPWVIMILAGLLLILCLVFFIVNLRVFFLTRKYQKLAASYTSSDWDELVVEYLQKTEDQTKVLGEIKEDLKKQSQRLDYCVQNVGIVRFNAFEDTGSDLSFAVAFLDGLGNGVVFSVLAGRDDCRTYGKPVRDGRSSYPLAEEEQMAINQAIKNKERCVSRETKTTRKDK